MQAPRMRMAQLLLALFTAGAAVAASAAGGYATEEAEPVPTGAELVERCVEYREQLAFTRAQLKARNLLGRWDFVVTEHRRREKFVEAHCDDAARRDADDQAKLGAADLPAPNLRQS